MEEPAELGHERKPGDLLGWWIEYGPKHDMSMRVEAREGYTAAQQKARHLENARIIRAVVG